VSQERRDLNLMLRSDISGVGVDIASGMPPPCAPPGEKMCGRYAVPPARCEARRPEGGRCRTFSIPRSSCFVLKQKSGRGNSPPPPPPPRPEGAVFHLFTSFPFSFITC
jgi:hypothetical protein